MPSRLYKILFVLALLFIVVLCLALWISPGQAEKKLEVDFLDVGQGNAVLIKTPYGQNILIDGGPDKTVVRRLAENLPWWDRTIDMMILTHPHDDHVNGLNDVIKSYDVARILYTGVTHSSPGYLEWLSLVRDYAIPLTIIDRPQTIELGENCRLEIFYPFESLSGKEVENLNNSSIVSKLIYGTKTFLLVGDIEKEVEEALVKSGVNLQSDILLAGHHGSDTSSTEEFLNAVNPAFMVIQSGKDNGFGHPSPRVLKRAERQGAKVLRNDLDGTIRFFSDGGEISLK